MAISGINTWKSFIRTISLLKQFAKNPIYNFHIFQFQNISRWFVSSLPWGKIFFSICEFGKVVTDDMSPTDPATSPGVAGEMRHSVASFETAGTAGF